MKILLKYFLLFLLLVFLLACGRFVQLAYVGRTQAGALIRLEVPEGASLSSLLPVLPNERLIPGSVWYRVYALTDHRARRPKPGVYFLQPGTAMRQLARTIARGPAREEIQARIIEGWTVDEITQYLHQERGIDPKETMRVIGAGGNKSGFDADLRSHFPFLTSLGAQRSLEGYLFPDTYRVWSEQLPDGLVVKQLEEFEKRFATSRITEKSAPLKTLDDIVILASIVEKEVREPEERRIVAGIFLRRLKEGVPLQSDATLSYITGSTRGRATAQELAMMSPYNSYKFKGLPPGPISNPGASAIQAVLDPMPTNYRYFLTDQEGIVQYASTLDQHVLNRRRAGY